MSGEWGGWVEPSPPTSELAAAGGVEAAQRAPSDADPHDDPHDDRDEPSPQSNTSAPPGDATEDTPTPAPLIEVEAPAVLADPSTTAVVSAGPTRARESGADAPGAPDNQAAAEAPHELAQPAALVVSSETFVASPTPAPPPTALGVPTAAAATTTIAMPTPAPPLATPVPSRRSERARHRRPRRFGLRSLAVIGVLVILGGSSIAARATVTLPAADVAQTMPSSRLVAATLHPVSWPTGVQAALAIPALGVAAASGQEKPAPIASLTKLMTAHIVLADHPLTPEDDGPSITITPADVADYLNDENSDQANIQVAAGEVLTEKQVLEGMLIHSANNFADLLAEWDAGSVSAFVTKMNDVAHALGMTQTTYSDASGFSTQSVSTPVDQLKLASLLTQNPVFDEIVDNTSVTLPIAGTQVSYTPLVGIDDVVGLKSGFTSAAGGCDILALAAKVDGASVEVLASITGYQGTGSVVTGAGIEALSVARQAVAQLSSVQVVAPGQRVGVARAAGYSTPVVAGAGISMLAWPGQQITVRLEVDRPPPSGAAAGWRVGSVTAQLGQQEETVPVATSGVLPTPSFLGRVF